MRNKKVRISFLKPLIIAGVIATPALVTGCPDEDGDPVQFASVQVVRERWINGRKQMAPMGNSMSNDLGEFRVAGFQVEASARVS